MTRRATHFGQKAGGQGFDLKKGAIMALPGSFDVEWHHRPVNRVLAVYECEQELDFLEDRIKLRLHIQAQYFDTDTGRRTHRANFDGESERTHILNVEVGRIELISGRPFYILHPDGWPLKVAVSRASRTRQSFDASIAIQQCGGADREISPCNCGASWSGNDYCKYECSNHLWQSITWEEDDAPEWLSENNPLHPEFHQPF